MVKDIGPLRTTMKNKVITLNILRLPSRPFATLHIFLSQMNTDMFRLS